MKKGQFNFVWLFAIIAGGAILVLAVYGAINAGDSASYETDTKTARNIAILTDPMEAGFAEGSFSRIVFAQNTTINNFCYEGDSGFGRNAISVKTEKGINTDRDLGGDEVSLYNKYIFSEEKTSGEEIYIFSKPFDFPYKVADMIFMSSESYCFVGAPDEIYDEVLGLSLTNVMVENCSEEGYTNVCFGSQSKVDCDMTVYNNCGTECDYSFEKGILSKDGDEVEFVGPLVYAAIFSDKEIYECNVQRLMYRTAKVADVLIEKADLMDARNCETNLKSEVYSWGSAVLTSTSEDLSSLFDVAQNLEKRNKLELCGLWD